MQFLLVQNKHQTYDWTLIVSGANRIAYKCEGCKPETLKKDGYLLLEKM